MGKVRKIAGTIADPTLPKTPISIDGKTYNLCCDFGALAEAESAINRELVLASNSVRVNLLHAMAEENLSNTRIMFSAALRTFHPEITFDAALKMVTSENLFEMLFAIREAWKAATPEKKLNPPVAQPVK